jgi:uncharacterized protein (TIGR03435 family)
MNRILHIVPFFVAAALGAQDRPEFEVASLKLADPTIQHGVKLGLQVDGAQVRFRTMSLQDLVRSAYRLKLYQVAGPDWIASQRFDIVAKVPDGAGSEQVPDMLKALLEDRLQLKAHREQKELSVLALTALPDGARLHEVPADPADDASPGSRQVVAEGGPSGVNVSYGPGSYFRFSNRKIEGRKLTMVNFVDMLGRFVDRPLIDETGLKGRYDLDVELTEEDYNAMLIRAAISAGMQLPPQVLQTLDAGNGSLSPALKPLGLKLESRKAQVDMVVVDSALKTPVEN